MSALISAFPPKSQLGQFLCPLFLTLLSLVLWLTPSWGETLIWSRVGITHGEYWRLLSGHLLHSNGYHLALNLGGLWLLFALHQVHYCWHTLLLLVPTLMLGIGALLYGFDPTLARYVGLSGVLHGLFAWGALQDIRQRMYSGYLLLLGLGGKLVWEVVQGGDPTTAELLGVAVSQASHQFGALLGVILGLLLKWKKAY